jgi:hypothetical protein
MVSAPSFRLAGSGWYETDFKKDGDKKRNLAGDAAKPAEPASAAKPESKPEARPAADSKPTASKPAASAD